MYRSYSKKRALVPRTIAFAVAVLALSGCARSPTQTTAGSQNKVLTAPTGAQASLPAEDGQWTMPAKDYASTRFSGLDQINGGNVANLKLAWTFSTGVLRGHEAAPIVVNNTMYIVTPYPNIVYALDLTQPGAPVKWQYAPNPEASSQGVACCDFVNRGVC
jgi:alcohol dehydrogenase (cytochrome c)